MAPDHPDPASGPVTDGLGGMPVSDALGARTRTAGGCEACGAPQARSWSTPDGPARLCPPCATLNGIGCP